MEQLMHDVAAFAAARGIKPATVLQNAAGFSGKTWERWEKGATCSLATAERIRAYIDEISQSKNSKVTVSENTESR